MFGAGFMETRRGEAREARLAREARQAQKAQPRAARTPSTEQVRDIQAGLRGLGCRADVSRRAAEWAAATLPGATLEVQLREALQSIGRMVVGTTIPASRQTLSIGSP